MIWSEPRLEYPDRVGTRRPGVTQVAGIFMVLTVDNLNPLPALAHLQNHGGFQKRPRKAVSRSGKAGFPISYIIRWIQTPAQDTLDRVVISLLFF